MRKMIISIILVLMSTPSFAVITLTNGRWSTTFNCADWYTNGGQPTCDGINVTAYNSYPTCGGVGDNLSRIRAVENYSSGGSSKGFGIAIGDGDGVGNGGPGPDIKLPAGVSEVYIRWYAKYPSTFTWNDPVLSGQKWVYISTAAYKSKAYIYAPGNHELGIYEQYGNVRTKNHWQDHSSYCEATGNYPLYGWNNIYSTQGTNPYGVKYGDGQWHYYEVRLKSNTVTSPPNGIYEVWVDGVKRDSHDDMDWDQSTFTELNLYVNHARAQNGGCVYLDVDDIAVSTTGYIGPLPGGGGGIIMPNPPGSIIVK